MDTRPAPKLSFTTIDGEPEQVFAPLTPTQFTERASAEYQRILPHAGTSAILQYAGTQNVEYPDMTLRGVADTKAEAAEIRSVGNFLKSLLYPVSARPGDMRAAAPPRVLVLWPNALSVICRMLAVETRNLMFASDGTPVHIEYRLSFAEVSELRIDRDEVRRLGSLRVEPFKYHLA